ncbi:MAG: hypothetical protein AVDCRST_MAG76-3728 [uncultured Acidimicrobiales bacterium]|uniref:Uncharacterized protein n=1 Tax=uncultured Acidimicrobiales bacterium TaxID=310071 RepID=A0A6J4JFK1_9ACTN|nr:MAG: hypothetical protein AVDCRST_MAG76-3728 [uncultured Acidimicrobiales bacterium]
MTRWFIGAIVLIVAAFVGGWTLVGVSGHGGNRTGGNRFSGMWEA